MKKWWQKSISELWTDLFKREQTRWIAVTVFATGVAIQNWVVVHGMLKDETLAYFGMWVRQQSRPMQFSTWFILNLIFAIISDALLIAAAIFVCREAGKTRREMSDKKAWSRR